MLMENTMQLIDPSSLKHIFDLKGSLVDRTVKGDITNSSTLKDKNYLAIRNLHMQKKKLTSFINFKDTDKRKLKIVIRKDVEFLRDQGLMDYSLLLAVENIKPEEYPSSLNQS